MQFTITSVFTTLCIASLALAAPQDPSTNMEPRPRGFTPLFCDDRCSETRANPVLYARCFAACEATATQDNQDSFNPTKNADGTWNFE